jgi:hypothetical protein
LIPDAKRPDILFGPRRTTAAMTVALVLIAFGVSACGVVNAAKKAVHDVEGNKATIDAFTSKVQSGETATFEATYVTTGSSPATIVYAVEPPKGLAFDETPSAGGNSTAHVVVNPSGEYTCTPPLAGSSSAWSCQKSDAASAASQSQIYDFYTPAHWVTFLDDFSLAAGIAGDRVTSSNMTVNGFSMQCVDFQAPGVAGTSTICSTTQGILGYVKVAGNATSFEIKSYSPSPPASLFETPPGATITAAQTGTS